MFNVACISILMLWCISVFDVEYKFKISKPKYLFLCLFLTKKWAQNGVYRKGRFYLLWDWYEVCQTNPFYNTVGVSF